MQNAKEKCEENRAMAPSPASPTHRSLCLPQALRTFVTHTLGARGASHGSLSRLVLTLPPSQTPRPQADHPGIILSNSHTLPQPAVRRVPLPRQSRELGLLGRRGGRGSAPTPSSVVARPSGPPPFAPPCRSVALPPLLYPPLTYTSRPPSLYTPSCPPPPSPQAFPAPAAGPMPTHSLAVSTTRLGCPSCSPSFFAVSSTTSPK